MPGVQGGKLASGKERENRIINLVRRTDPFIAHYLFPNFLQCRLLQRVQVCRKAKSPWGRRLGLARPYGLFELQRYQLHG
jgi:hypothetical protein